jgi:HEAT repeat protein
MSRNAKIVLEWRLKLPVQVPTNQENRMRAMYGFRALGAAAKSAFPEIVAMVLNSPDDWQRTDAINALTDSDADTMRRLADGLKSPSPEVRLRAVNALTCLRIAPDEVCLPALERATSDPDTRVAFQAVQGIALINQQLTAVAGSLTHHNPEYREIAAHMIGGYRARARSYLPALEVAAHDPDLKVRAAACSAIEQIRGR